MGFLAGEDITAGRLNRLQPTTYWAQASGTVAASQTNVDVPGATLSITTQTANAQLEIVWFADFDMTGAGTATGSVRPFVGATGAPAFAVFGAEVTTDRGTPGNTWVTTVAAASTFTVKLVATTTANQTLNIYTTLKVTVTEVV